MSAARGALFIDGDRVCVPPTAFTHAGFRTWVTADDFPAGVRAAFLGGEVLIDMSPESLESHNQVKLEIAAALQHLARERDLGEVYTDGALLTNESAGLSCEPDAMLVTWETFESGRILLTPKMNRRDDAIELVGTPDLVVEVLSDASVRKDLQLLREAYLRAGIAEYWLVDARNPTLSFEILQRRDEIWQPSARSDEPQSSSILGVTFTLSRTRNRIGRWTYRLAHT